MFSLFQKRTTEHLILFDITTSSVAGAYVEIAPGVPPTFFYTKRVPVTEGTPDTEEERLLAAFSILNTALITEGAPLHYRATKTGHIDKEIVSVGYPWQKTTVHTKTFDRPEPFIFTEEMRDFALQEITPEEGRILTGRFLLATLLNGYHIGQPIGKKVKRADLLMLGASVEKQLIATLEKTMRKHFHAGAPHIVTFAPIVYFVMQDLYPHEEEVMILNISRGTTDIALVKKHLLVDVSNVPVGSEVYTKKNEGTPDMLPQTQPNSTEAEQCWIEAVAEAFKESAARQALPRTIFLLAEEGTHAFFKNLLDSKTIKSLWLSDTKLNIVPVESKHLASFIRTEGDASQDLFLSFLALFYSKHKELVP